MKFEWYNSFCTQALIDNSISNRQVFLNLIFTKGVRLSLLEGITNGTFSHFRPHFENPILAVQYIFGRERQKFNIPP